MKHCALRQAAIHSSLRKHHALFYPPILRYSSKYHELRDHQRSEITTNNSFRPISKSQLSLTYSDTNTTIHSASTPHRLITTFRLPSKSMDLEDVRRKRLRLFNPGADTPDTLPQPSKASPAPLAQSSAMDISDDEKMARQLQAEWEQEVAASQQPQAPPMPQADLEAMASASGMSPDADEDERVARELQAQYNKENAEPSDMLAGPQSPGFATPGDAAGPGAGWGQASLPKVPTIAKGKRRSTSVTKRSSLPASIAVVADAVDESEHALAVRSYVKRLKTRCGGCGKTSLDTLETIVTDRAKKVKNITNKSLEQDAGAYNACIIDSGVQCYSCTAKTCMGCGEVVSDGCGDTSEAFEISLDGYRIAWHCDRGRLAFIWLLLCIYDHLATHNKPQTRVPTLSTPQKDARGPPGKYSRSRGSVPAGIGYGGNDKLDGYDYYESDFVSDAESDGDDGVADKYLREQLNAQLAQNLMQQKYGAGQKLGGEPTAPDPANKSGTSMPGAFPGTGLPEMPSFSPYPAPSSKLGPQPTSGSIFSHPGGLSGFPKASAKKSGVHGLSDLKGPYTSAYNGASAFPPGLPPGFPPGFPPFPNQPPPPGFNYPNPPMPGSKFYTRRKREQSPEKVIEDPDDALTTVCFGIFLSALPSLEGRDMPTNFDFEPPSALLKMLLRSSVPDRAAELLRNDGIDDVTRRAATYNATIDFVRALYSHPVTSAAVSGSRDVNRACHDLLKVSLSKPTRMADELQQTCQPVLSCCRDLISQGKLMLANAFGVNRKEFESDEAQQTLTICKSIVDFAELLEANGGVQRANGKSSADDKTAGAKPQMIDAWQQELALCEVPDDVMLDNHAYGAEARRQSDPPAGRMRHLIKEVTRLKTSLPPGIFVRYGASRLDVMKVLIVGPADTPYCNGLFEFDMYCGLDFPQGPPKMIFRTTGGGVAHFNPNLYTCGKVCLSLLGMWQGEKWRPGQSTILQILVSLQAMVLCDEPHCNEPSYEGDRGTPQSKAYNRHLYPMTVRYAMLDWLESKKYQLIAEGYAPREPLSRRLGDADQESNEKADEKKPQGGIWDEVVQHHFSSANEDAILKVVGKWVQDKPPQPRSKGKSRFFPAPSAQPTNPAFMGTGWAGKTLGGDPIGSKPQPPAQQFPIAPSSPSDLDQAFAAMTKALQSQSGAGPQPPTQQSPLALDGPPSIEHDQDIAAMQQAMQPMQPQTAREDDSLTTRVGDPETTSGPGLIPQLKGALTSLEANARGRYHGHAFPPDQFNDEQDDDEEV